ncbi:MAG: helix-hairpin-helix domain-containing protein, partial [Actinomycetota bacterium]|nr:helix-hairpin-helix domain-containing protein [Actinomycetota bacterium]
MPDLSNLAIAGAFDELADLYELDGAVIHRVLAYRTAAKNVRDATQSVARLAREGRVTELPGIGKTLEQKIVSLLDTGAIPSAEKLRAKYPPGLVDLTRLPGLGPKRAKALFDELGIDSLEALHGAAEGGRLRDVRGFGERFEQSVLAAFAAGLAERPAPRMLLPKALAVGEQIVAGLRERVGEGGSVELAGSARRLADSVKDLDVVAATRDPAGVIAGFGALDVIASSSATGEAGARGRTHSGLAVDLRVVAPEQFGNLLQHFTGSKAHNVALREAAVRRGLHVSEYGILDDATGETVRCATEDEVYATLGLTLAAPELREDRGELAPGFAPPRLLEVEDLRGDLHCHTVASDGRDTAEAMALAARARGLEYLAITDHSASHGFGNHVSPDDLRRQIERVRALDARLEGIRVLVGSEVNILPDGSPDYDDELLAELDWGIASVHTAFAVGREAMTRRMVAAIEHPLIDAVGHPTGRKIGSREPYAVDVEALVEAAARTGTMLEINSAPDRRDLTDLHARAAAEAGVPVLVDSDAHGAN